MSACSNLPRIRANKPDEAMDVSLSQGSDIATSFMRSSDGFGADGELTPKTKKSALEAMRKSLNRSEYTPRTPRDPELEDEEDPEEQLRKLQNRFLDSARSGDFRGVAESLAEGVDLHCCTARGQTALMLAATSRGQNALQIISFLLERGSQDTRDGMSHPCRLRCRMQLESVDHFGWTALLHASRNDMKEAGRGD